MTRDEAKQTAEAILGPLEWTEYDDLSADACGLRADWEMFEIDWFERGFWQVGSHCAQATDRDFATALRGAIEQELKSLDPLRLVLAKLGER